MQLRLFEGQAPDEISRPKLRPVLVVLVVLAGLVGILVFPIPAWLLVRCALLGTVVGLLWAPHRRVSNWIGTGVLCLGWLLLYESTTTRAIRLGIFDWQSKWSLQALLAIWSVIALFVSLPPFVNYLRRRVPSAIGSRAR